MIGVELRIRNSQVKVFILQIAFTYSSMTCYSQFTFKKHTNVAVILAGRTITRGCISFRTRYTNFSQFVGANWTWFTFFFRGHLVTIRTNCKQWAEKS